MPLRVNFERLPEFFGYLAFAVSIASGLVRFFEWRLPQAIPCALFVVVQMQKMQARFISELASMREASKEAVTVMEESSNIGPKKRLRKGNLGES